MAAGRTVSRLAAVLLPVAGLVAVVAGPAAADGDEVRLRAPSSFTAGGSPGSVTVSLRRDSDGCIIPRTSLLLRKSGLTAEQVRVDVARSGRWQPLGVRQAADGAVSVTTVSTEREPLCGGSATTRYRVTLAPTVPGGQVALTGAVSSSRGRLLGTDSDTARVRGGAAAAPTHTPKPTATPEVEETEPAPVESALATVAPAAAPTGAPSGGGFSLAGIMVMGVGGLLVAVGLALLFFLLRRSRRERGETSDNTGFAAGYAGGPGNGGSTVYPSQAAYQAGGDTTAVFPSQTAYRAGADTTAVHPTEVEYPPPYPPGSAPPPPTDHTRPLPMYRD